jgi:hypothetical protein
MRESAVMLVAARMPQWDGAAMPWRIAYLFLILALSSPGCSAQVDNSLDQVPAVAGSKLLPYKVALVEDQAFREYVVKTCSTPGARVKLQPAMSDAIKAVLAQNFRNVLVIDDLTQKTADTDFEVFPVIALTRGVATGTAEKSKDSKDPKKSDDFRGSIDLLFKDARTGNVVTDFRTETSGHHSLTTGDVSWSLMTVEYLNVIGAVGIAATLQLQANHCRDEVATVLGQDLHQISVDLHDSTAFTNAKASNVVIAAAKVATAAVKVESANPPTPTVKERRVALVIGNGDYKYVPHLNTPRNDAPLMAKTLQGLGFTLVGGGPQIDLDKPAFEHALQDFGDQLHDASIGLFYYAGDGMQVRGKNYLVPILANPAKESDADFQLVDAEVVLHVMQDGGARMNIMVLDACRNNPFGGAAIRGTNGGLVQMQAPEGTLISYASQPGTVASEGSGLDSPFTQALSQGMQEPGLNVFRVFNEVGLIVKKNTNGEQEPWISSSPIEGEFYFAGRPTSAPAPSVTGSVN